MIPVWTAKDFCAGKPPTSTFPREDELPEEKRARAARIKLVRDLMEQADAGALADDDLTLLARAIGTLDATQTFEWVVGFHRGANATDLAAAIRKGADYVWGGADGASEGARRFPGLSHAEALAIEVPPTRELVEDLIEAGSMGTIAALPETHKSFLVQEISHKLVAISIAGEIANGTEMILGRFKVLKGGPAAYWWQDDSMEAELGRLQTYARKHGYTSVDLPLRWHLNEGLVLPDDIPVLVEEIEREGQIFVVLDSLYNFLPGRDLKDEQVGGILAQVKMEVTDRTGCALCFIDHSPWPTEGNRGQARAYGSVFKRAAIRWGIYLDRRGEKLWISASGNNVRGLKRSLAVWDEDELELRLVEPEEQRSSKDEILAAIAEAEPNGLTTPAIGKAVGVSERTIQKHLAALEEDGEIVKAGKDGQAPLWRLSGNEQTELLSPPEPEPAP